MYAIVGIKGQQFKVEKDAKLYVHRLEGEEGSELDLVNVLLVDNDGAVVIGTPTVENTVVKARILSHLKGDKVLVFKKKRRKGYQKLNGHRQYLTQIQIEDIVTS
jgi:large subunit ribosomal protein L21